MILEKGALEYQQKDCKAYELTLDNDGVPFVWTSNVQIITI